MDCIPQKNPTSHTRLFMRVMLDAAIVLAVCIAPWWTVLILGTFALFYFQAYEIVFAGILLDSLYINGTTENFFGEFVFTAIFCTLISVSCFIAPYIRGVNRPSSY